MLLSFHYFLYLSDIVCVRIFKTSADLPYLWFCLPPFQLSEVNQDINEVNRKLQSKQSISFMLLMAVRAV